MEQLKVGKFIAILRKENGLTQEALGEKLGVTNKTISRWETGVYMPDIEMMKVLSELFSVSINELLCGTRLNNEELREQADNNVIEISKMSEFSIKIQKIIRCLSLVVILLSTMLSWYGGARGVQEIKGFIIFYNPITILFLFAVIVSFFIKKEILGLWLNAIGFSGFAIMELWTFFTWYILTITGRFDIAMSFQMSYPEFYISFIITIAITFYNFYVLFKTKKSAI